MSVLPPKVICDDVQAVASIAQGISLTGSQGRLGERNASNDVVFASLPSEIVHGIVLHLLEDPSPRNKRALSPCILTCRYWAVLLRPAFFRRLTLGSQEDMDTLLILSTSPSAVRPSLADCLHTVVLEIRLPSTQGPWWHHARKLQHLPTIESVHLAFVQAGPSWYTRGPAHALSAGLPRTLPTRGLGLTALRFDGLGFADTLDVSRLLDRMPTVRSCTCRDVVFGEASSAPWARAGLGQQCFEVVASRCTIVGRTPDYAPVAATVDVCSALLATARCPPRDAEMWARVVSLVTVLFTEYRYDVRMLYLGPDDDVPPSDTSGREMAFEVAFGAPPRDARAPAVSCTMSLSDAVAANATNVLSWCTYAETVLGLEEITVDARRAAFVESDVLEERRARRIFASRTVGVTSRPPGARVLRIERDSPSDSSARVPEAIAYRFRIELANFHVIPRSEQHSRADFTHHVALPGIIIPQRVYNAPGRCTYLPTIRFYDNGRPGILLSRALQNQWGDLVDGNRQVRLSMQASRITVRINWPGYPPWPTVTNVFRHSFEAGPMTMAQLAHRVAKVAILFWEDMIAEASQESGWSLSEGAFDQLVLLELRHISTASWQPAFCRV